MRSLRLRMAALLLIGGIWAVLLPGTSRGEGWSLGAYGGYTGNLLVATTKTPWGRYPIGGDGVPLVSIQALRSVGRHFSIAGQVTYLSDGTEVDFTRAQYLPIGIGVRYTPFAPSEWNAWPYLELSPTVTWSHWGVNFFGDTQETSLQPGMTAGFGLHGKLVGKVAMEVGFRYLWSTDKERRLDGPPAVSQTLEGLRQTSFLAGLSYAL